MSTADWVALGVVVLGVGVGGYIVVRKLSHPGMVQVAAPNAGYGGTTQPITTPASHQQPGTKSPAAGNQIADTITTVGQTAVAIGSTVTQLAGVFGNLANAFGGSNDSSNSDADVSGDGMDY